MIKQIINDIDIVKEAIQNEYLKDAIQMLKEIQEELYIIEQFNNK